MLVAITASSNSAVGAVKWESITVWDTDQASGLVALMRTLSTMSVMMEVICNCTHGFAL